jgi:AcrR family transcriptional regulator
VPKRPPAPRPERKPSKQPERRADAKRKPAARAQPAAAAKRRAAQAQRAPKGKTGTARARIDGAAERWAKRTHDQPSAGQPARRDEVLEAALELISEHGVAGASLRMLARKLGMSQPSLYHYFASKDALVAEIIDYSTQRMLGVGQTIAFPKTIEELPGFAKRAVLELYATESHPRFVRFLFLVGLATPQHRAAIRRVFEERLNPSFALLVAGFGSNDAERAELREVTRMVVYSLGFMLLDERALLGRREATPDTLNYAEWVEHAATTLLVARGLLPHATSGSSS